MSFATITKRRLFENLRDRADKAQRCPSLRLIVTIARLKTEDEARHLLLDLQRDNVITILRMGPYPWITIKRRTYIGAICAEMTLDPERFDKFDDGAAPAIPVRAELAPVDTFVDRLRTQTLEASAAAQPGAQPKETAAAVPASTQPAVAPAAGAPEWPIAPKPARKKAARKAAPDRAKRSAAKPAPKRRARPAEIPPEQRRAHAGGYQINIKVQAEAYDWVRANVGAPGQLKSASTLAREIFMDGLALRRSPKLRVRAAVIAAHRSSDLPLDQFIAQLLELGLTQHLGERA